MQNKHVVISEQTPQINIYGIKKLNSAQLGITISEEVPCIVLI